MTYTYLMKSGKIYKIGKSKNPENRLTQLRTANPDVRLIAFGNGISEKDLHRMFKKQKHYREWYNLSKSDIEQIIRLLKNEFSPTKESKTSIKKLKTVINFGKFKGRKIQDMTTKQEIKYMKWFVINVDKKQKNNKKYIKLFKWWLKQLGENDLSY